MLSLAVSLSSFEDLHCTQPSGIQQVEMWRYWVSLIGNDFQPEIMYMGKLQDKLFVAKVHHSAERMKHKKWQRVWQLLLVQPLLAPEGNRFLYNYSEQWITTLKITSAFHKSGVIK